MEATEAAKPVSEIRAEGEADEEKSKEGTSEVNAEAKFDEKEGNAGAKKRGEYHGELHTMKRTGTDGAEERAAASSSQVRVGTSLRHMEAELYKAAKLGDIKPFAMLSRLENIRTPTGNCILHIHLATPSFSSPYDKSVSLEFLNNVISKDPTLVELINDQNETPLHTAANFGHWKAVRLLHQTDTTLLRNINMDGDTALHMAARNKHVEVVNLLLKYSQPFTDYTTNLAGKTPLYLAVESGSEELVIRMLQNITTPQHESKLTGSILHAAVLWGNEGMVKAIRDKYPELLEIKDQHGQTPVHYAAGIDNSILQVLLNNQKHTAAYIQDNEGRTPVHIAAQHDNVGGLKLLMRHSPDSCEIVDHDQRNIVHYAAFLGQIKALGYLMRNVQFSDLINKQDNDGNTPLHLLASSLIDLSKSSVRRLQFLLPELRTLNVKTCNNKRLTAGDIANSFNMFQLEPAYQEVVSGFRVVAPKGGLVKHWLQPLMMHKDDMESQKKDMVPSFISTSKTHMVVAALIATVSFASGLAVPGGFNQDEKDAINKGTPILSNRAAFRAFVISDCLALACSLTAILCYIWIAIGRGKSSSKALFLWAFQSLTISIIALMVAFMTGTYSILQPSNTAFAITVIGILGIFSYFYCIFAYGVYKLRTEIARLQGPEKFKEVLHGQVETRSTIFSFLCPTTSLSSYDNLIKGPKHPIDLLCFARAYIRLVCFAVDLGLLFVALLLHCFKDLMQVVAIKDIVPHPWRY